MAISRGSVKNKGNLDQQPQDSLIQNQKPQQQQSPARGAMRGDFGRDFKRSEMGEVLTSFVGSVNKIIEGTNPKHPTVCLPVDGSRHGLHFSAAAFVQVQNIKGQAYASTYVFILEGSAAAPRPLILPWEDNKSVEIILTASDAWDKETEAKVRHVISGEFDGVDILIAGATVIPADLDVAEYQNVIDVVWQAAEACSSRLETEFPTLFPHYDINQQIDRATHRVHADFSFGDQDDVSVVGKPIRSDITLRLSAAEQQHNRSRDLSSFQHTSQVDLVQVNAYTDLVFAPPQPAPYGHPQPTQCFLPRIVLTRIQALEHAPLTPETYLLGLATMCLVTENYSYAEQFRRNTDDTKDIGAIGYRMRNPQDQSAIVGRIDTSTTKFTSGDLYDLLQQAVQPHPIISLDCEQTGPDTWLTVPFAETAKGNGHARQYLIEAANRLTGGLFQKYFDGNDPIVINEQNKVYLGTYTDDQKRQRDLRHIDSLAILNIFGDKDMSAADMWEDTNNNMSVPPEVRLNKRYDILRNVLNGSPKIAGWAERVTFTQGFLSALVQACIEAGLMVDKKGLTGLHSSNQAIGNTFLQQYAYGGNVSGMVNQQGGPSFNMNRSHNSRW